jgi:type I restriction enzyme S subunit
MIANLKPYPAYKESGLPWLGQLPEHWETERAKWLFTKMERPVRDGDDVVTCFRDGMVTLRKNRRLRGFTEATVFSGYQGIRKGDLVIHGMDAFAGAIGVSDSDGMGTPVYNVCQPRSGVNAEYYAHLVRQMSQSQWILALAKGIRERSTDFRFEMFGNQDVPLPPPSEQAAIVRFLDWANGRLERAIRAKRKVIALLNEQKQAIIHRAVTRGLDPSVPLKPSGIPWLGDIPAHWETPLNQRIFKEEIRPHNGAHETQLSLSQRDGLIATSDMKERSLQTASYDNWKVSLPGDLVLNRFKAHLGVFFEARLRGIVSFHYGVFAPRRRLHTRFFELLFHTYPYRTIYAGRSNGMTVGLQNLSNQNFYGVRAAVPPVDEQGAIVDYAEGETQAIRTAISRLEREIELLREYRTRLVADVVTGKLDVREAAAGLPVDVVFDNAVLAAEEMTDLEDEVLGEEEEE